MGIYMNKNHHPEVYKNERDIKEPNQSYYEYNYFSEMINEQKKINESLHQSFQQLNQIYTSQSQSNAAKWDEVNQHLYQLNDGNKQRQQFENHIMEQFVRLQENDEQVKQVLASEKVINQDL